MVKVVIPLIKNRNQSKDGIHQYEKGLALRFSSRDGSAKQQLLVLVERKGKPHAK